jgi:predicted MFS family arabinose efflux permease
MLNTPKTGHAHWSHKLLRVDFLGAVILLAAVSLFLLGLDNGSNKGWSETVTLVPLALTPLLFAAFILVEVKVASNPFAPGHVILDPPLLAAYGANFFALAAYMGVLFFLALYLQAAMRFTATQAGLVFLPSTVSSLVGSLGSGHILKRTGKYWAITLASVVLMALSVAPMAIFSGVNTGSVVGVVIGVLLLALGTGSGR